VIAAVSGFAGVWVAGVGSRVKPAPAWLAREADVTFPKPSMS
jgi:hypothetical protein